MPILVGHADELRDDLERKLDRDIGHEVEPALRSRGVEKSSHDLTHPGFEHRDLAGREAAVHDLAQLGVTRCVEVDQQLVVRDGRPRDP